MKFLRFLLPVIFISIVLSSCTKGDDPRVIVTVLDENDRPIPNATVTFYSRPGDFIIEDMDFTNNDGETFHQFVFEGTLDVVANINNYSIYDDLSGEGEVELVKGETFELEIILHEPIPIED